MPEKIYLFYIKLDFLKNKASKKFHELKVVAENEKQLVFQGIYDSYQVLEKQKSTASDYNGMLNKPHSGYSRWGKYTDEITTYYYTDNPDQKKGFKIAIKSADKLIYDKFGRYSGANSLLKTLEVE